MFTSSVEDLLHALHSHIVLEDKPLTAAIFTLIFTGYPAQDLCQALSFHLDGNSSYSFGILQAGFENISTEIAATIYHNVNNPARRLVVAVEAILGYLFDDEAEPNYSRSQYEEEQQQEEDIMVPSLLAALLWALPRAGISEEIALYSRRTFLRDNYRRDDLRISLVEKCLNDYNTRVQNAMLEELDRRVKNGKQSARLSSGV